MAGEKRIHISLPGTLAARLQQIQRDTHASTLTEVFKDALMVYAALLEEHKKGNGVFIKDEKSAVEVRIPLFL